MEREKSCGAIVFRRFHGNVEVLLIKHVNGGHWSFPKGHVEEGETEIQTAQREIYEETGIKVIVDQTFRHIVTYSPYPYTLKDVVYFVAKATNYNITPQPEEVAQARWIQMESAFSMLTFDNDRQLLNRAVPFIKNGI